MIFYENRLEKAHKILYTIIMGKRFFCAGKKWRVTHIFESEESITVHVGG